MARPRQVTRSASVADQGASPRHIADDLVPRAWSASVMSSQDDIFSGSDYFSGRLSHDTPRHSSNGDDGFWDWQWPHVALRVPWDGTYEVSVHVTINLEGPLPPPDLYGENACSVGIFDEYVWFPVEHHTVLFFDNVYVYEVAFIRAGIPMGHDAEVGVYAGTTAKDPIHVRVNHLDATYKGPIGEKYPVPGYGPIASPSTPALSGIRRRI